MKSFLLSDWKKHSLFSAGACGSAVYFMSFARRYSNCCQVTPPEYSTVGILLLTGALVGSAADTYMS